MNLVVIWLSALCVVAVIAAVISTIGAHSAEKVLDETLTHDPVTGLANRSAIEKELEHEDSRRALARGTAIIVEIEMFSTVNDAYGHEVGDALLTEVARQLDRGSRDGERLARYQGPQFVVLCPDLHDSDAALQRASDLQAAVEVPYQIGDDQFRITTVAGIAVGDRRDNPERDLLGDALLAVTQGAHSAHDQRGTRGRATVFEPSMRAHLAPLFTEQRLAEALEREEFWLLHLPVIALDTSEIVGTEALIRWADPQRGVIPPSEFLDVLNSTGRIVQVGEWVIRQACEQSAEWARLYPNRSLLTTVNISYRQLAHPDFVKVLIDAIRTSGIDPEQLCLELDEKSLTRDIDNTWMILRQVKEAGVKLAVDDFGIGLSSLTNLRRFQLDILKIDRSFISNLGASHQEEAIVEQLVGLAHSLDIVPVAEGVESEDQVQVLKGLRCDYAQGYYFSEPQSAETMGKMIERGKITPGTPKRSINWSGNAAGIS